ncbi:hypothetical protein Aros01_08149 [Streptosporangium roseum]
MTCYEQGGRAARFLLGRSFSGAASSESRGLAFPVRGSPVIFHGGSDFDLELIDSRTLDGRTQELTYRPTLHA